MPDQNESLWTVNDVSSYLRVSRTWVYQHANAGELPSLKIAGVLRFEPEAIRAVARGETNRTAGRVVALRPRSRS